MTWSLVTDPLIAPIWLAALGALAVAATLGSAWLRAPGTLYRAAAFAVLLMLLANPTLREEDREPIDDVAVLLIDKSASMSLGNRSETRDAAVDRLKSQLELVADLDVRIVESDQAAKDGGTALFGALDGAIADIPRDRLAGVLVVSDGQVHDVPSSLTALGIDAPLHGILVGDPKAADRKLVVAEATRFGIVGEPITIRFRVDEEGNSDIGPVTVQVNLNGDQINQLTVMPGADITTTLALPHGGENVVEIIADALPDELTEQNNKATLVMTGIRDRLRVLLVSGEPHAGERTWRNLLKADPSVDLVHFTILRPPEKQDGTPISELSLIAFPTRELFSAKLDEFDLIIFDRYRRRGVLPIVYLGNVARYVENGGAVLAAAGPAFASPFSIYRTPLAGILPAQPTGQIVEQGYRAALTDEGNRHPVTAALPGSESNPPDWGRWFRLIEASQTSGRALMEGPEGSPLMVLDTVGEGRVAQLLSDHAWLWARGFEGGGPQAELLRRLAHWLMKEPDLEEERLLATGKDGALSVERRTMAPEAEEVTITLPSGSTETLTLSETAPGRFTGLLATDEIGLHKVADATLQAVAAVGPANPREFMDIRATDETLSPLIAENGGGTYWIEDLGAAPTLRSVRPGRDAAGDSWAGLQRNGGYVLKAVAQVPLLSPWLALPLMIGLLLFGWRRESK
eukprot:s1_g2449.t1